MRALVFTGSSRVELLDVEEPVVTTDEVLVHVRVAGICGSELHGVREPGFRIPPLIMGHEFAGTTSDGADVIVNPILSCMSCDACRRGDRQICPNRQIIGVHRPGGFAQRVAVPRSAVVSKPAAMSWTHAGVVEPAANAVHAWSISGARTSSRIGIVGAGAIGLSCLLVAANNGARSIVVADRSMERLAIAGLLGASDVATELIGTFDVVFDAVGVAETRQAAFARVRPGGTVVFLGLAEGPWAFDAASLVRSERRLIGSFAYTDSDFAAAVSMVGDWTVGWAETFPLELGDGLFMELMGGRPSPVKALLNPTG